MSIKYDSRRESVAEIIKKATFNATYVIPDLQRPYVWSPRQVTMLMDSVFRGWPFGTLLLWEVKPDCFLENEGIPHRPFWQVVDRTRNDQGAPASSIGQPATYQMVLDGQQRIQSLILALGGDQWGFKLYDSDWALDLQDRRVRPSNHWSKASLCLDLHAFAYELAAKHDVVRRVEAGRILDWVVLDSVTGQSADVRPPNYVHPLATAKGNPGRFIRLSRIWELAQKDLSEREYRKLLAPILDEHSVAASEQAVLLDPLAEFMKVMERVKTTSFVDALQIESFQLTPQWSKDDYSDAIVNIFTRLNTAGRTLTREEITLAWLKVGWDSTKTIGRPAGQCLDDLKNTFGDYGFQLETDEVVRLISFIWAVESRGGALLDSKDLLKGEIVRSMATSLASGWARLEARVEQGVRMIRDKNLVENQGSFNAVIVFLAWYKLTFDRFDAVASTLAVVEQDRLEKRLEERAARFLDRWIFGSQWAGVWGDAAVLNFQNFATDLNSANQTLRDATASNLVDAVEASVSQLMGRVLPKAAEQVTNTVARDRRRVHIYAPFLWVWHRLDDVRWQYSAIPMRTGRKKTSKLEVDHAVADAWWARAVTKEIERRLLEFEGTEQERATLAPECFESRYEAYSCVNLLGNCSLLDKSFNVSKSDKPMWTFLQEVHEFKSKSVARTDWEKALMLNPVMTSPDEATFVQIKEAIQRRDTEIRKDLIEFLNGAMCRAD